MSTLYTCHGKDCPLKDERSGLRIIPPTSPYWTMTIKPEMVTNDMKVMGVHLCEACVWTIREMVEP